MKRPMRSAMVTLAATLLATASLADEINIYSSRQEFLLQPVIEAYEAKTGNNVNTLFIKDGLEQRLMLEGKQSPADLIIDADFGRLLTMVNAGLTQAVESDALQQHVPPHLRDPNHHWFALTQRARIIVASRERVPQGRITQYADLADPSLRGKICVRSGKHGYNTMLIASRIAHHGIDATRSWLGGVKDNLARKPQGNDRAQVRAIAEGECDLALINTYYLGVMAADPEQKVWADQVYPIFPDQDTYGSHVNVSGVALAAHAPHDDAARDLMEFMVSEAAQQLYAESNSEYPVREGVALSEIVASWGELGPDTLSLQQIADHRSDASKLVDELSFDQ
ncbi:extracellular solute-binding protein [Gammaproteobacteria bacterium]|nr:extracellular solute-binding protein [Gammaproteobacteria bacterium]